jgi:hypothetical protein
MKAKSIFQFRWQRESRPPAGSLVSTAPGHAFEDREERRAAFIFVRRCGSQFESSSRRKCRPNLPRILRFRR